MQQMMGSIREDPAVKPIFDCIEKHEGWYEVDWTWLVCGLWILIAFVRDTEKRRAEHNPKAIPKTLRTQVINAISMIIPRPTVDLVLEIAKKTIDGDEPKIAVAKLRAVVSLIQMEKGVLLPAYD